MSLEQFPHGTPIHGELNTSDAAPALVVPLTQPASATPGATVTIGLDERLALVTASLTVGGAAFAELFFDNDSYTTALDVLIVTDAGGSPDTLTIPGDLADMFRVGRSFDFANSSNNDGTYVVTVVSYDADTDITTVSVATGSWTDGTNDGDVTIVLPLQSAGFTIVSTEFVIAAGQLPITLLSWPIGALRLGPYGYAVYGQTSAAIAETDFGLDGFVQRRVTKTDPIAPQAR